eukprot:scaffold1248_cov122-Isochrysis_galbana.AAC.9
MGSSPADAQKLVLHWQPHECLHRKLARRPRGGPGAERGVERPPRPRRAGTRRRGTTGTRAEAGGPGSGTPRPGSARGSWSGASRASSNQAACTPSPRPCGACLTGSPMFKLANTTRWANCGRARGRWPPRRASRRRCAARRVNSLVYASVASAVFSIFFL